MWFQPLSAANVARLMNEKSVWQYEQMQWHACVCVCRCARSLTLWLCQQDANMEKVLCRCEKVAFSAIYSTTDIESNADTDSLLLCIATISEEATTTDGTSTMHQTKHVELFCFVCGANFFFFSSCALLLTKEQNWCFRQRFAFKSKRKLFTYAVDATILMSLLVKLNASVRCVTLLFVHHVFLPLTFPLLFVSFSVRFLSLSFDDFFPFYSVAFSIYHWRLHIFAFDEGNVASLTNW